MKKREPCTYRTTIGGQALIEGILMRGPKKQAVAVRRPDGLIVKEEELKLSATATRYLLPLFGAPSTL